MAGSRLFAPKPHEETVSQSVPGAKIVANPPAPADLQPLGRVIARPYGVFSAIFDFLILGVWVIDSFLKGPKMQFSRRI